MSQNSGLNHNHQSSDLGSISEMQMQNVERINEALKKVGIDIEGNITKDEISIFLDQNSTNGNFNQALKEKIFKALYTDEITEIPVREFVVNFSALASELRKALTEYEKRYKENKKNIAKLKEDCEKYKNEKLDKGISEYASFKITFLKIEFKKLEESMENKSFNLALTLYSELGNEIKSVSTEIFGVNSSNINEEFEFSPKSKDDYLILQLFSYDDPNSPDHNEVGQLPLPLNKIENQEEFELDLVIPSRKHPDDEEHNLTVKTKAIFIWSQYDYCFDLLKNKEEMKKKIEAILLKTKNFYDSLYNLNFFDGIKQNFDIKLDVSSDDAKNDLNLRGKNNNDLEINQENRDSISKPYQSFAETIDNALSHRLNGNKPNWVKITGIMIPIFAFFCFLNTLIKPDYINFFLVPISLLALSNNNNNNKFPSLKIINIFFIISFIYDLIWFIICGGNYLIGDNSTITKKIIFFITIINVIIKLIMFTGFIRLNSKK